jgi:drug/metabolite transporter (DMT)-like permease
MPAVPTASARPTAAALPIGSGALACLIVGGSVPVTGMLDDYPVLAGQAMRYALGGLLLLALAGLLRRRLPRPAPADLLPLAGLAVSGMLGFNACLLYAQRYADPGFVAAMLGGTPLVLALVAPLLARRRPAPLAVAGATVVVTGILVLSGVFNGGGSWHGPGLALCALTMGCEASFTLLAVGVVARLGAFAVSTWCCLVAAGLGALLGPFLDAPWRAPNLRQAGALVFLGVVVTAVGFCCWYRAVSGLGADRAGVLVGLMPVAGLITSVLLGAQPLTAAAGAGAVLVTSGAVLGLGGARSVPASGHPQHVEGLV